MAAELVRQGLLAAGFPAERISPGSMDEEEAVQRALETAQPGDLLVIFGDDLDRVWHQIVTFGRPAGTPASSSGIPAGTAPVFTPDEPPLSQPVLAADPGPGRQSGEHED